VTAEIVGQMQYGSVYLLHMGHAHLVHDPLPESQPARPTADVQQASSSLERSSFLLPLSSDGPPAGAGADQHLGADLAQLGECCFPSHRFDTLFMCGADSYLRSEQRGLP
jgi:hypothetical protein